MCCNLCLLSSLMFSKAIAIVVAMDKEVLHWRCIFRFTVTCFGIRFIGRSPKWYKNRWWFFISEILNSPEKILNFCPEI